MTRQRFWELFKIVFGKNPPQDLVDKLEKGESVRDKIAHGMKWEHKDAREALVSVIEFASEFNDYVHQQAGFRPFGDLRGFKGRAGSLEKKTTRWVLKGMGIPAKEAKSPQLTV